MSINRRDIIQMLRDENELLKTRNKQVGNKLARAQQAFRALNDIEQNTRKLTKSTDIMALFSQLLGLVLHACNSENGSLVMVDDKTQELEFVEVVGDSRDALMNHRIPLETGIVGHTIASCQPMLIKNVHASSKWSSTVDNFLSFHAQSLMCAPLFIENQVIGAIELVNHVKDSVFDENDLNVLRVAACYVGKALEQAEKLMLSMEVNEL